MDPPAPTRLPSEIIHRIFKTLDSGFSGCISRKKGLASCSLTCKHWAARLREALFFTLTLRNLEDVTQIISFFGSSISIGRPLSQILRIIFVHINETAQLPWVHYLDKLVITIRQDQRRDLSIRMCLTGDGTSQIYSLPLSTFPRSVPKTHVFTATGSLSLKNVRLRCCADLIRFSRGFPRLRTSELNQVLFLDSAQLPRRLLENTPAHAGLMDVSVCGCGDGLPDSQLALAAAIFPHQYVSLNHRDWNIVSDAILSCHFPHFTTVQFHCARRNESTSQFISLDSSENLACDISSTGEPLLTSPGRSA